PIQWNNIVGAEPWEVERLFTESYYDNPIQTINFVNNATRVRIDGFNSHNPYYKIPGIDDDGVLIFRVRPISKNIITYEEEYGPWSMDDVTENFNLSSYFLNNSYPVQNYNTDIN